MGIRKFSWGKKIIYGNRSKRDFGNKCVIDSNSRIPIPNGSK